MSAVETVPAMRSAAFAGYDARGHPHMPRGLKAGWLLFMVVWTPVYAVRYGPPNFLWFCDGANFLLTVAILWDLPRLVSAQAVGVFLLQLAWCVDFFGALIFGSHPIGGTEYMFDPSIHLGVRTLSLFHVAVPVLLLWALHRFGYHRDAWRLELPILWALLVPSFFFGVELNLNWAWHPFGWDPGLPVWLWIPTVLALYPAVILGVSHRLLAWLFRPPPVPGRRAESAQGS